MKFILIAFSLLPLLAPQAQERAAGSNLEVQTTWAALKNMIEAVDTKATASAALSESIKKCGIKGMLYAPGTAGIDGEGCKAPNMPNPAALNINSYTNNLCTRGGNHTVVSACPAGQRLLGCGGGPGDQHEDNEYWVLQPDFKNNRCLGYVGNPACYGPYFSQVLVIASCYQP